MKTGDAVVFACIHNAGRSQMAAAWFNALADSTKARAVSAGTEPGARVHPEVLEAMREVGVDLSDQKPQKLTGDLAHGAQMLITMGCGEQCPVVPGLRYAARGSLRKRVDVFSVPRPTVFSPRVTREQPPNPPRS